MLIYSSLNVLIKSIKAYQQYYRNFFWSKQASALPAYTQSLLQRPPAILKGVSSFVDPALQHKITSGMQHSYHYLHTILKRPLLTCWRSRL